MCVCQQHGAPHSELERGGRVATGLAHWSSAEWTATPDERMRFENVFVSVRQQTEPTDAATPNLKLSASAAWVLPGPPETAMAKPHETTHERMGGVRMGGVNRDRQKCDAQGSGGDRTSASRLFLYVSFLYLFQLSNSIQ